MMWNSLAARVARAGVLVGIAVACGAFGVKAQDSGSLRAEKVVDFQKGKIIPLAVTAGPIKINSVEFTDLGRAAGQGGIAGRMRSTPASELSTTLRARFDAENPKSDEWELTATVEFLDKNGKAIDRVTKKESYEGEAKPWNYDHQILEYVVPAIAQVRIKFAARFD